MHAATMLLSSATIIDEEIRNRLVVGRVQITRILLPGWTNHSDGPCMIGKDFHGDSVVMAHVGVIFRDPLLTNEQ